MNYNETMEYIKNTAKFGSNLGLERTEKILELLGDPQKKIRMIHIAGTNGKGSTTAMISKILLEQGYKVGMYTSPFLEEFEERIQIDEKNIQKEELAEVVTEVAEVVASVAEMGYGHPTEFEIITCAMFLHFYKKKVDFAVIEVGLGGRLDSTNVITPLVSIITSISLDHTQVLGDTIEKIAFEKAGIIKDGVPVVLYPQNKEAEKVIEETCKKKRAKLVKISAEAVSYMGSVTLEEEDKKEMQKLKVKALRGEYEMILSLLGKHQLLNCATAVFAMEVLEEQGIKIEAEKMVKAFSKVKWIGRMERMKREPLIVIDGAHNIDGIRNLKESIEEYFRYKEMILILGILADKQVEEMVKTIVPLAARVITVTPHSDRGELAEELKKVVQLYNANCEAIENYEEAYKKALEYSSREDLILISGSLYMIGDMRKIIKKVEI